MNRLPSSLPSIAVSAVVKPSRVLLCLVGLQGIALLAIAAGVAFSYLGNLPVYGRFFVACLTLLAFGVTLKWIIGQRKVVRLDISTNGQVRLVEHNGLTGLPSLCRDKTGGNAVLRLMPDSVLWPGLLLLRLETETHRVIVLPILRDSMSAEAFRALSVACRWIAAQNNPADSELI